MKRILVIDDELAMPGNGEMFAREYAVPGFLYEFCGSLEEAVRLRYWEYALILLDIRFEGKGDEEGLGILHQIRQSSPLVPVVMLSSRTTPDILIRCWDDGAQAYIVKWTSNRRFHKDLEEKIRRHARYLPAQQMIGESAAIIELRRTVETLAGYDISVLITGETGTGKELIAHALHEQGKRNVKPFVAVNCGAIPGALIESELFGHAKGAFTGATSDRRGKVEEANEGTLFLDEIGDLPSDMQVKLLRLLDAGEFVRVGENTPRRANIRVVAATNKDLDALVHEKAFREDLFFRLNGFKIRVPSLREHKDDLPLLAEHFLEMFKNNHPEKSFITSFSVHCMRTMQAYAWPGNIREIRNAVERAMILTAKATIERESLPESILVGGRTPFHPAGQMSGQSAFGLPEAKDLWSRERLLAEIRLCFQAKQSIVHYKGRQWKAEFMRLMYPQCKAANAKGFDDLVRRFTKGPWGDPKWASDKEIRSLIEQLKA